MPQLATVFGTIPAGAAVSSACNCLAGRPVRLLMPPLWDPAVLTFMVSVEGTDFYDLFDHEGNEVKLVCDGGNRLVSLPPNTAVAIGYVKLRSGTSSWPVKQSAARTFRITLDSSVV